MSDKPVLTHYDLDRDPFGDNLACGFVGTAETGKWGVTSERNLTTCPDCILRLETP
jgi:hypothetical protein